MALGLYSAAAALASQEQQQAMVARNITSSMQPGSRKMALGVTATNGGQINTQGSFDGVLQGYLPKVEQQIDLTPGAVHMTGNSLDFALASSGFFEVNDPVAGTVFTRNGQFHPNAEMQLVDSYGRLVQGVDGTIQLQSSGGDIYCDRTGRILQGNIAIGKLAVVDVPADNLLPTTGGFMMNPDKVITPTATKDPNIIHKSREDSNHSIVDGMVSLIDISRSHEMTQKIIQAHDEQKSKAINAFGKLA